MVQIHLQFRKESTELPGTPRKIRAILHTLPENPHKIRAYLRLHRAALKLVRPSAMGIGVR